MMVALYKAFDLRRFLRCNGTVNVLGALISCCVLCASFLPWYKDPLGEVYSAWQLPIYPGWPYHTGFLNYGLLCLCCALYAFLFACHPRQIGRQRGFVYRHGITRFVFIVPMLLFLFQHICIDVSDIALLARHERQLLLIQQHFGYQGSTQLIPLNPYTLDISTLWEKLQLVLDTISYGPLFLCAACLIASYSQPALPHIYFAVPQSGRKLAVSIFCIAGLVVLFIRAPIGMLCEYAAKKDLAAGDYAQALSLLDSARFFNPGFEQAAYYHAELGQAQYFLSPGQLTADSRVYLASTYRAQGDYLDAYQQLSADWQMHKNVPWIVDEMDTTLENMTEARRPLRGLTASRINADDTALPWLNVLLRVDPSNPYAIYATGRIQYDLHNYQLCIAYMSTMLKLSLKDSIKSSIYTYMALGEAGLGNYRGARLLLFKAVALDPGYHNNTAREELSGLH